MLKSSKHVFWEALVVTVAIFLIGIFLGILIETRNTSQVRDLYALSEINLVDGLAVSQLSEDLAASCEILKEENIDFANRVYQEARLLEELEASGKLTDGFSDLHKKYDLLRTLLWMSNQRSLRRCDNYDLVVYLYEYETEDIQVKALQNVWSKILVDLREHNDDVLLLPIAADQNLTSLNILMKDHEIKQFPAIVVNNREVLYELENEDSLTPLLS